MVIVKTSASLGYLAILVVLAACGDVKSTPDAPNVEVDAPGPTFPVAVTLAGNGVGIVSSEPAGIICGQDCTESFAQGTVVTLTATPSVADSFAGWTGGGCSGIGTCTLTVSSAVGVTATFSNQATLSVMRTGTGTGTVTSSPAGINCGSTCLAMFAPNSSVMLTAAPSGSDAFTGWGGGACTGTGTCTTTLINNTAVTAAFMATQRLGHTTQFTQTSSPSPNFLLGEQVVVTAPVTLHRFGLIASAAGANVKMALYTDVAGSPGTLVAQTAATAQIVGNHEISPTAPAVALPAGTYWLVAVYDVAGSIYYTTSATTNTVKYITHTFANALPTTFGTPTTYMGQSFNYYLVVY